MSAVVIKKGFRMIFLIVGLVLFGVSLTLLDKPGANQGVAAAPIKSAGSSHPSVDLASLYINGRNQQNATLTSTTGSTRTAADSNLTAKAGDRAAAQPNLAPPADNARPSIELSSKAKASANQPHD